MRVPLSWLRELVPVDLAPEELADVLTMAGLEVEAIHRPSAGTRGVVVAEVRSVAKVEGSDKLHLVEAFDGHRTQPVVCGAANYARGDRVAWAQPGAVLPGGLRIGSKELFGHTSNGMLASARELGVGDDHRGIWVLEPDAPLGEDLAAWLDLDDPVLEIAVTPDRAYAMSVLGVARDVAALTGAELRPPRARPAARVEGDAGVPVRIADPGRCARFDARRVQGVRVGPSPAWLQRRLAAAGVRPVSNVVDATNHAMLETGHPVHAYDVARLAGPVIEVREARPGEALVTLDGARRELQPGDLVIADAQGPIGLAGVMGGAGTEVAESTTDVLIEVAAFDPPTVGRTARRNKLFTEASSRFERTVPPQTVPLGATRAADLIVALAGGTLVGATDTYAAPPPPVVIPLRTERARAHLGMAVDDASQQILLEAIGCALEPADEGFTVTPPTYRADLVQEADLYEEIARLHGYERVPERVPSTGRVGGRGPVEEATRRLRGVLAGGGWTEVLVFPFVADEDLRRLRLGADDPRLRPVRLVNPLSAEEAVLRTTLLPGLLRSVRHNVNRQVADVAIFELGHVFLPPHGDEHGADGGPGGTLLPVERTHVGFAACGDFVRGRHDHPARPVDLYDVLGAVALGCRSLGRPPATAEAADEPMFHPGRCARLSVAGAAVGVAGELHPAVAEAFGVPARTVVGELRLDRVIGAGAVPVRAHAPSPLPGLRFDVAVEVDEQVPAGAVADAVRAGAGARLTALELFDVYRGPSVGEGRKSLAYALRLDDAQQQLTDADEAAAIAAIDAAVAAVGGRLRR